MRRVYLIACGKNKRDRISAASDLYTGSLFRKSLAYARSRVSDENIRVLSARHGLVKLGHHLSPYEETLNAMSVPARVRWGVGVARLLRRQFGPLYPLLSREPAMGGRHFVLLAGARYRDAITGHIDRADSTWEAPLAGLGLGQQLQRLDELCAEVEA